MIQIIDNQVVKSRAYSDHRRVGNIEQTIEAFNRRNVDEIIVLDTGASKAKSGVDFDLIQNITTRSMMPLSYGGGITTLSEIAQCLALGCDKVIINHYGYHNFDFISKAMDEFGMQAITLSVDVDTSLGGEYFIYDHVKKTHKETLEKYLSTLNEIDLGELFISSVSHDGIMNGYDIHMLKTLQKTLSKNSPILFNGGCGEPKHMAEILDFNISACCGSSIFLYSEYSYSDIKRSLIEKGYSIRQLTRV